MSCNGLFAQATAYAGPDTTICQFMGSYTISGASASNYSGLLWVSDGAGTFSSTGVPLAPIYTFGVNETGPVRFTLCATGISNTACDSMILTIQPYPIAFCGLGGSITNIQTFAVTDAYVQNVDTFYWAVSPVGAGTLDNVSIINPVFTPSIFFTGTAYLTLVAYGYDPCGTVACATSVQVTGGTETMANAGPDVITCQEPGSYAIVGAFASNYTSLTWTTTGPGSFDDSTSIAPVYTYGANETGLVMLTLTAHGPSISSSDTMILTIQPTPVAYPGTGGSINNTETFAVTDAYVQNVDTFYWGINPVGAGTLNNISVINPVFTPSIGFTGTANLSLFAFGYAACADILAIAAIQVSGSAPPSITGSTVITPEDTSISICCTISNPDSSSTFTATICGNPQHGTLSTPVITGDQLCTTFTPNPTFSGSDQFRLQVCESGSIVLCDTAIFNLIISPVNDPPQANDDFALTSAGFTVAIEILSNDTDIDGSLVPSSIDLNLSENGIQTVFVVDSQGVFEVSHATGMAYFTPNPGFSGNVTPVSYQVCDNGTPMPSQCDIAEINVSVVYGPLVYAGVDTTITAGQTYWNNTSSAANYWTLLWSTSGSGTFNNTGVLQPTYTPSESDIAEGVVMLWLTADSAGIASTDTMVLTINPQQELICSTVNAGSYTDLPVYAYLFSEQENGTFTLQDETTSILNEDFCFEYAPTGNYIFYAEPDSTLWNSYIPTYYSNVDNWEDATRVNPGGGGSIELIPVTFPGTGGDSIYGTIVFSGDNPLSPTIADSIVVLLYNNNNEPVKWTKSDNNGFYSFSSLPDGDYIIKPTITGYTTNVQLVTLLPSSPAVNANFVIYNSLITSLHKEETYISGLYPNPATNCIIVTIAPDAPYIKNYAIVDLAGKTVVENSSGNANNRLMMINAEKLCNGFYILRLQPSDGLISNKRFEILR